MSFVQYLNDTKAELRHVAWPTRLQTIVYTTIVILISIGVAFYLGFFDYIFTTIMSNVLETLPSQSLPAVVEIATSTPTSTHLQ